ncbi:hypothetical protein [Bradyrhizobium diazoefficiens]|uniref:hypothetical protein n=1 Tax=Bradyrhizobium diazoefficiens TaxID=1355477 RepID=UPI0027146D68|nr:hypothetical protein [Bradyrhizobium diazoefficiens]WLA54295.1 hypothetical protein QIH81_27525 [Bradyrhizobium diazoefficiens]
MFVYRASRPYLAWMLVSAFVVGVIVQAFGGRIAPVYGGRALVQLGAVDGNTLTRPATAIAAMDTPSFRQHMLQLMGSVGGVDSRQAKLVFESLSARPDADDVIAVSVRATDEKLARQAVNAVVRLLDQKEEQKRERRVADIKAQLAALDAHLSNLTRIQESLLAQAKSLQAEPTPLGAILLLDVSSRNEEQQASVRASKLALQRRLELDQTHPTRLVDDDFPISLVAGSAGHWRATVLSVAITLLGFILLAVVTGRKPAGQD